MDGRMVVSTDANAEAEGEDMPRSLRRQRLLRVPLPLGVLIGLVAQFLSPDPRSPLVYFTVLNAIALALVVAFHQRQQGPRGWGERAPRLVRKGPEVGEAGEVARLTFVTGAVFAGVVYTALIAPQEGGPYWLLDSPAALVAALMLHGATPILAVLHLRASHAGRPPLTHPWVAVAWTLVWPIAWGVVAVALSVAGVVTIPYPFLDPALSGWPGVLGGSLVLLTGWVVLARLLVAASSHSTTTATPGR